MWTWICNFLFVLPRVRFWFPSVPFSEDWDKLLNEMMDSGCCIKLKNPSCVDLGGVSLYLHSYPRYYGTPANCLHIQPMAITKVRLKKYIEESVVDDLRYKAFFKEKHKEY